MTAARRLLGRLYWGFRGEVFWVNKKYLYGMRPAEVPADRAAPGITVSFRDADARDLDRLTEAEHDYSEAKKTFARERLAVGDRFIVGESEGRIVIYGWLTHGNVELGPRHFVPAPPDVFFSYNVFTVIQQRGKRLMPALYGHLAAQLQKGAPARLMAAADAGNPPALRAHQRAGFDQMGAYWEIRLFSKQFFWIPYDLRRELWQSEGSPAPREMTAAGLGPRDEMAWR